MQGIHAEEAVSTPAPAGPWAKAKEICRNVAPSSSARESHPDHGNGRVFHY